MNLNNLNLNEKIEDLLAALKKKEDEKEKNTVLWVLAIIGAVAAVAGIAFAVYRFFAPDYLEDFEEDFDDDFDDYFEDEEEYDDCLQREWQQSNRSMKFKQLRQITGAVLLLCQRQKSEGYEETAGCKCFKYINEE